ncbi:ATP-dependent RecD-like DNA helicase [Virgibacillus sp. C22-A2]|uniref:ATP-dependent RecD2 DNA helicase n=1 Tax=Virgibacillus tibetensis TaxID=3042313 RepID=A0ABU6KAI2_9BACI|nr:ATP-dependent RecD-like DNA helicase [Virgibacillus sp. C22-A2]
MGLDGQSNEKGYIKGEVLYTIFHNETEHFSIAKIKVQETNEDFNEKEVVAKGYFTNLQEQTTYYFFGDFEKHSRFGLQYKVNAYQTFIPSTKDGLISYLSSDLFFGVGEKTATRIVEHLGESAISKILNNPDILSTIPGIKKATSELLTKSLQENQGFEHVVVYLSNYGVGLKMAQKIYEAYKDEAIDTLEEDPYRYVFDIEGFGFQTADEIARKNGLSLTHPNRIGAGCIYVLQKSVQEGHVYLPLEICVRQVLDLLSNQELSDQVISTRLTEMNTDKSVIIQHGNIYLPSLYYAEDGFISHLKRIIEKPIEKDIPLAELMKIIGDIEETEILSYGKDQFEAINQALHSKVAIVTGGPGTGKTTVIKGILNAYAAIQELSLDPKDYDNGDEYPFVLTAPTGRASKRLKESTGLPAVTIHRLLGWDGKDGFERNQNDPLSGKFLIVDEFSMVDIWLANNLFKAIPDDMQVLIVGDEDQLPSVGPGQVLSDLLSSELIPFVSLNEVYRQKEGSKIIQLAHDIKNDTCTIDKLKNDEDFSFINCNEYHVIDVITKIISKAIAKGIDIKDIQVLAPMYRSQAGITLINKQLQQLVNPKTPQKREVKANDITYRVGDKVIQLVNQPEDGVYNGDIGEVVAIFKEDENTDNVEQLVLLFEEKEIVYERKDYMNIMHAYCVSIHKSQGSEFPIVILPVVSAYNRMLRKNLLYTAITRSKESLIICGEVHAFLRGIQTMDTNKRYTSLREHLLERIPIMQSSEAESDEKEISPYDFM